MTWPWLCLALHGMGSVLDGLMASSLKALIWSAGLEESAGSVAEMGCPEGLICMALSWFNYADVRVLVRLRLRMLHPNFLI